MSANERPGKFIMPRPGPNLQFTGDAERRMWTDIFTSILKSGGADARGAARRADDGVLTLRSVNGEQTACRHDGIYRGELCPLCGQVCGESGAPRERASVRLFELLDRACDAGADTDWLGGERNIEDLCNDAGRGEWAKVQWELRRASDSRFDESRAFVDGYVLAMQEAKP